MIFAKPNQGERLNAVDNMKITIITAVLNRESTIGHAIRSVIGQSYHDIELIIMDGRSTDGTLDVVRGFDDPRIRIFSERDHGIYDALNRGISRATGDIIGVVHSDDFLAHDNVISAIAKAFNNSEIDAVYGDLDYVSALDPEKVVRSWRSGRFTRSKLTWGWMPPHPTLFLKREVFERLGAYDTSYRIAADYDAVLRYFGSTPFRAYHIPDVLVKMRMGGISNKSLRHIILKSREDLTALKNNQMGGLPALIMKNVSKIGQFK